MTGKFKYFPNTREYLCVVFSDPHIVIGIGVEYTEREARAWLAAYLAGTPIPDWYDRNAKHSN